MTFNSNFGVDHFRHQSVNKLNLHLQGPGQTVIRLFEAWKGFVAKLDVYTWNIQAATFHYFKYLKAFSVDHQVNAAEIDIYMRDLSSQFAIDFKIFIILIHCFLFSSTLRAAKT